MVVGYRSRLLLTRKSEFNSINNEIRRRCAVVIILQDQSTKSDKIYKEENNLIQTQRQSRLNRGEPSSATK
jgi:hypothetical protein